MQNEKKVAIVGLGYVGLPLALAFGRVMPTIGYDVSRSKILAYREGIDPNREVDAKRFQEADQLRFTDHGEDLSEADFIIVAVPTPIDQAKQPDLKLLEHASETVGRFLKRGAVVSYESTVFPGVTEEICVPILETASNKRCGEDFFVGYSPERINPGDQQHTLEKIVKVVSGQDSETLNQLDWLYSLVVEAGVYRAASIKVAEASKVIENTQRDLNIALVNELAKIFNMMGIDTSDVLAAASTKWNFSPYRPGLVGGHCVGVDPYYLTYRAQSLGYHPQVILAGRRINDDMGKFIAEQTVKKMAQLGQKIKDADVFLMGLTFKENCSDLRNSRANDIVTELRTYGVRVRVWDPVADPVQAQEEYGVSLITPDELQRVDAVIAAVPHDEVRGVDLVGLRAKAERNVPFMDVKAVFDRDAVGQAGFDLWRL